MTQEAREALTTEIVKYGARGVALGAKPQRGEALQRVMDAADRYAQSLARPLYEALVRAAAHRHTHHGGSIGSCSDLYCVQYCAALDAAKPYLEASELTKEAT